MSTQQIMLEKIRREAQTLTHEEQLRLVEKLIHQLRETVSTDGKSLDLSNLYGLGKGLWKGEDAQEYVNGLREDRI
ncbi:MAG: hypothetical protein ACE5OR_01545 [bacterium]